MDVRTARHLSSVAGLALALVATAAHATDPADLCTGDPCVISGNVTLDPGSFLDFGPVALRFASSAVVQAKSSYFRAASITLEPGARLTGGGVDCDGADFESTAGDIAMQENAGLLSRIEVAGTCPGSVSMYSAGNVDVRGFVNASASGPFNSGGSIGLSAVGSVTVRGSLIANAGSTGTGGYLVIDANGGGVDVDASLDVSSALSGGVIEVYAYGGGDVSLRGSVDIRGGSDSGGRLGIVSELGDVLIGGTVLGQGSLGNGQYTCSGDPSIDVEAPGDVTFAAIANLNGAGEGCISGYLSVQAGGRFTMEPGAKLTATGLSGSYAGGATIRAGGDVVLRDVDMSSPDGGGSMDLATTGGAVQVLSKVKLAGPGGSVDLTGCDIHVAASGTIDVKQGSGVSLTASETMTVVGTVQAAGGGVALYLREGTPLLGGTISPAPVVQIVPGLPDCRPGPSCTPGGSCGDGTVRCGEECDDGAANGTPASACDAGCVEIPPALRIPGGGSRPYDCPYEWAAALGTVSADPLGVPKVKQSCRDNDPTCDFEPAPGLCRLHLWSCLGGADARLACSAAQVSSTSIASPRASSTKPAEIAARQALAAALLALGAPVGPGETCSPRYELTLGVGQKPLKLKTKALFGTKTDSDQLQLTCTP